jgi:hypothetical protein
MCVAAAVHATVSGSSGVMHSIISKGDLLTRFVTFMARSCHPPSLSASSSGSCSWNCYRYACMAYSEVFSTSTKEHIVFYLEVEVDT